jgi:hypothetical protein
MSQEERRDNYTTYEEDGRRVNRDNIGNWEWIRARNLRAARSARRMRLGRRCFWE